MEQDEAERQLIRKLTLKRIGMRQGQAISKIKVRKNGYDSFNQNRKHWSNARNGESKRMRESTFLGDALTTSIMLGGKSKERFNPNGGGMTDSINLFQSHFEMNLGGHNQSIQQHESCELIGESTINPNLKTQSKALDDDTYN